MDSGPSPTWKWLHGVEWRPRVRWFAAEYLIIVLGVLTALVLNSAWKEREARKREVVYLQQLASDLSRTLANIDRIDSLMVTQEHASAKLVQAF